MDSDQVKDPLKQFTMLSIIGKGSYAKVALVRKKKDGYLYALKSMKKKYIQTKNYEKRALLQKEILATINHPFLVQMDSAFQNQKKLFLVLEYCPGGQLFRLLKKKRKLTQDQTRFYVAQIVLALQYLHENNIIYRDLKPQNILVDEDGYIKLTDFGLSINNVVGEKDEFTVCGTPQYLAPEVLNKVGHGRAVDWWCLGCLIYELISGFPPFYTKNRNHMFDKIKSEEPYYEVKWSKKIRSLLPLLLEKNPEIRLSNIAEIKNHPWFGTIDWEKLIKKEIKPHFIPKIEDELDIQNFDRQFTECSLESDLSSFEGAKLSGFSFNLSENGSLKEETGLNEVELVMDIKTDTQ